MIKRHSLAKKYALAFMNTTPNSFNKKWVESAITLDRFFKKQKALFLLLHAPTISASLKLKALNNLFDKLMIDDKIRILVRMLLEHQRLYLLRHVMHHIIDEQRMRNNIVLFTISSSRLLTSQEQEYIIEFLAAQTNAHVSADFIVNPELIAGVRAQSSTFLWERSISHYLQHIKQTVLRQATL